MKKFNINSFLLAIKEMEEGYFKLDKENYKAALIRTKHAIKGTGLSLRNNMIFKYRNIKIPGIVIPIHSLMVDYCGVKKIYIQVIIVHVEGLYEDCYECSLIEYNIGKYTFRNTCSFMLNNLKEIKRFIKRNNSLRIKPDEFNDHLVSLYNEYFSSIPRTVISNSIGWQLVNDVYQFYPVSNQSIENQDGSFLNNIYASSFGIRSCIKWTDFLNFNHKEIAEPCNLISKYFIKTKTDMLLFYITIYSFCRMFFMQSKDFTPFSIFVHSNKPNSFVWKYVSFWVDLFVAIDEDEINKNDLLGVSDTGNEENKKGVKMIPRSNSDEKAQSYRKPIPYNKIKQLIDIKDKDMPIIIKNPSTKTKNKKALVSKNEIDILNQCKALPILIQPEGSEILPTMDSFILVEINDKREEKDLLILGTKKDQLLSLYHGFIEYLNKLGNNLISTLDIAFKSVLNDIESQNISLINGADHYVYLWVSAYLFSYSMKPIDDYNYSNTQDAFTKKARQYFIDMIKDVSNYKPIIQLPQCFDMFRSFIKQAVANSIIKHGNGSLDSTSIGWIEIINTEESLYLKDNYYPRFISYCEEMGLQLKYTPKHFKKHVLVEKELLVPQYRPSSPEVYVRYDVFKKVQGEKIKTIRVNMKKLNI